MAQRSSMTFNSRGRRKHRPLIFIGGDKGGVGKSFAARVVASWLVLKNHRVHGIDGDMRNGHLDRFCAASFPVARLQLRTDGGWAELYQKWEQSDPDTTVIVDLPGNIGDAVDHEQDRFNRIVEALGRTVILIWVACEEEDSIWLLKPAQTLARPNHTLFIMNGRYGADPTYFQLWQESKSRAAFISEGGKETLLPVLPIGARTEITRSRSPFHDLSAANLTLPQLIDFEIWWEKVEEALKPLASMLEAA